MCHEADEICLVARQDLDATAYGKLNELRNSLQSLLSQYKDVLGQHGIALPFAETP